MCPWRCAPKPLKPTNATMKLCSFFHPPETPFDLELCVTTTCRTEQTGNTALSSQTLTQSVASTPYRNPGFYLIKIAGDRAVALFSHHRHLWIHSSYRLKFQPHEGVDIRARHPSSHSPDKPPARTSDRLSAASQNKC